MKEYKKICKKIGKDINKIICQNKDDGVNNTIRKIKTYYKINDFNQDILIYRMNKLRTKFFMIDTLFGGYIGAVLGLTMTPIFTKEDLHGASHTLTKVIVIAIFMFLPTLIVYALAKILFKRYSSLHRGYITYFHEAEIKIIKDIIEESGKKTKQNAIRNSSRYLRRRTLNE